MKPPTASPLTYFPAYAGLFASLVLAAACNSFLDIQYGTFGFEMLLWAVAFGLTLRLGWRAQGHVSDAGRQGQKMVLILGLIVTVIVFGPLWGFPRAGLAILATLQAAQNCVTVSRRQLHMGLLVSLIMVLFAASHYRADWTMLFYLVPYITAVVFTLVAEQINSRVQDVSRESLGAGSTRGQWAAIVAATTTILLGGALFYAITPQVTWYNLFWKYGQPGNIGSQGNAPGSGQTSSGQGGGGSAGGDQAEYRDQIMRRGGLTLQDMRDAARRKGMPRWQSSAIDHLADLAESVEVALTPIRIGLDELWNDFKKWLDEHRQEIALSLLILIVLSLLVAAWRLLREARPGLWLFAHLDYLRLGILKHHAPGNRGAIQYYAAMQRLLDLHGLDRLPKVNTREYLARVYRTHAHLSREAKDLTQVFENARYGDEPVSPSELIQMRERYRRMFHNVDSIDTACG